MECRNTNSSLDTLFIFDCDEDLKSDKYSSLDSFIINHEDRVKPMKHHRHYKSKREHRCRRHKKKENNSFKTKLVTQEVHVKRQNFKCIINLNTTVCDHSNIHQARNAEPLDTKSKIKRIVPQCMRQLCCQPRNHHTRFLKHSKEKCTVDVHHATKQLKEHESTKDTKHDFGKCRHGKRPSKRAKQNKPKLSKVLPPSNQFELELEEISTTSLDSYIEIPESYKHVKNPRVPESKLDTLIRRAKERERKRNIPRYKVTPSHNTSSMIFPINFKNQPNSNQNKALNSQSTIILEPKDNGYSPSIDGLAPSPTFERYFQFSNIEEISDFELNIKAEPPTMPIDAYSPTKSNLKKEDQKRLIRVKKEIKIEPKFEETDMSFL